MRVTISGLGVPIKLGDLPLLGHAPKADPGGLVK
jgi:hypothetical protein